MTSRASDYRYLWKPRPTENLKEKSPKKERGKRRAGRAAKSATVYRLFDASGVLLYVGCTTVDVAKRLRTHHCYTQRWWSDIARVEQVHYAHHEDALLAERRAIWYERPVHNLVHSRAGNIKPEQWNEEIRARRIRDTELLDASGVTSPHLLKLSGKIPR